MTETITPEEVLIALVSGFGNTKDSVKNPHKAAAANLHALGFTVVEINPNYENGKLTETRDEIREARNQAAEAGMRFVSFGTSAGGTVATEERMQHALENGKTLDMSGAVMLNDKGVTACSRVDFSHHPSLYGEKYFSEAVIRASSPVLEEAVEFVRNNLGTVVFSADDTLCFTGGKDDGRIPPESSVLPHAKVIPVISQNGTKLNHDGVVGRVLTSPGFRNRVAGFAIGKAA